MTSASAVVVPDGAAVTAGRTLAVSGTRAAAVARWADGPGVTLGVRSAPREATVAVRSVSAASVLLAAPMPVISGVQAVRGTPHSPTLNAANDRLIVMAVHLLPACVSGRWRVGRCRWDRGGGPLRRRPTRHPR